VSACPDSPPNFRQVLPVLRVRRDGGGESCELPKCVALSLAGHDADAIGRFVQDLQEMVNEVGGVVDFQQFAHIMTKKMKDCDIIAEIQQAFRELDEDGDGYINKAELKVAMETLLDKQLHPVEVDELMREADVDGDGKISQHDFVSILTL